MIPSILTFEFGLILGSFLSFWGPNVLVCGIEVGFDNSFGIYSCSRTTFISMFLSILTFDFDLILGSFFTFGALMGCFWAWGKVQQLF